jgi:ADP-ribosylation factor-like protein 3
MDETSVELSGLLEEEKLKGVPVLIFANKQDLANALSPDQVQSARDRH